MAKNIGCEEKYPKLYKNLTHLWQDNFIHFHVGNDKYKQISVIYYNKIVNICYHHKQSWNSIVVTKNIYFFATLQY